MKARAYRKDLFGPIDEMLRAFGDAMSVCFVCWAYPPFMRRGTWVGRGITRELRCGVGEDWMRLTVHEVGTDWSRTLTRSLARAGYEAFALEDETIFRRDWHNARERDRELAFARSLGELGTPANWPIRRRNRRRRSEMSVRDVKKVIAAAKRSRIEWHEASLVLSRRTVSRDGALTVMVHLLLGVDLRGQNVSVHVMTQTSDSRRLDRARRAMRAAGYDGGRPAKPWFGSKDVRSLAIALRERDAIIERLTIDRVLRR